MSLKGQGENQVTAGLIPVTINGEGREIPAGNSVTELLQFLDLPADRVAVELNKAIVRKRNWRETFVAPEAHVEIVEFVGGG